MLRSLAIVALFAAAGIAADADADERPSGAHENTVQAVLSKHGDQGHGAGNIQWVGTVKTEGRKSVRPPTKLAIIACRVEPAPQETGSLAPRPQYPDWHLPVECMRVLETVTDAAALNHLWLRQMTPNLADYGTCSEVAMSYTPIWEASHRNWLIVKVGCPTKIVDADGRTVGWHMPECQGTLPGTTYPLRCRFDPSEI